MFVLDHLNHLDHLNNGQKWVLADSKATVIWWWHRVTFDAIKRFVMKVWRIDKPNNACPLNYTRNKRDLQIYFEDLSPEIKFEWTENVKCISVDEIIIALAYWYKRRAIMLDNFESMELNYRDNLKELKIFHCFHQHLIVCLIMNQLRTRLEIESVPATLPKVKLISLFVIRNKNKRWRLNFFFTIKRTEFFDEWNGNVQLTKIVVNYAWWH